MKGILFILLLSISLLGLQAVAQTPEVKPMESALILRSQSYPTYTRIVLEGDGEILRETKVLRGGDSEFIIEFKKKPFSIKPTTLSIKDGLVRSVEFLEKGDKKILTIFLEKAPQDYKSFLLKDPPRRVLDLYKVPLSSVSSSPAPSPKAMIVIDPGHGGPDSGAVNPSGLQEKVVVLDIAFRIKTLLQRNPDIRVTLTRTSDVAVSLRERAYIGNSNRASIFISLHGNSSFGKSKKGFIIYHLPAEYKSPEERNPFLWDIQYQKSLNGSIHLADILKEALKKGRGEEINVREAPILELLGVEASSVLLEIPMGPEEEKNLQREDYKNRIASEVVEAIINYIKANTSVSLLN